MTPLAPGADAAPAPALLRGRDRSHAHLLNRQTHSVQPPRRRVSIDRILGPLVSKFDRPSFLIKVPEDLAVPRRGPVSSPAGT